MATEEAVRASLPSTGFLPVSAAWKRCIICQETLVFKSPREFCRHLRDFHCTKEGGSFVCRYGAHGVCPSLPVEGVSDKDYEDHVARDHVSSDPAYGKGSSRNSSENNSRSSTPITPVMSEPSVVQDQHKWTIFMARVNLPAALNDPRLARRETDFFSKTWGDSFERAVVYPSPYLASINKSHFEKYLHKTSNRLKRHVQNTQHMSENNNDADLPVDSFPALHARHRLTDKSRVDLEAIPKIFMLPNFSLENTDTFNAVFPWTQIETARQDQAGRARQSSKLLQEKLSHYLDLVEVQIAKQISLRSEAFFHAMTSHDELQEHMSQTCAAIKHLRDKIHNLDAKLVEGPLRIMKYGRTRNNYVKLFHKLKMMSTVHQTQPTIQLLLSTNEFVGALDLISTTQEVLTQELAGIHSFRHLGSQLAELEKVIDKMMQEDFIRYVTADLNRPLEDDKMMEEERLVSIVFGMLRQHRFNFVDVYRDEACTTLKATIKQTVVDAVSKADDIDTDCNVGSLADQMRLLDYSQWMMLLNNVFKNLSVILQRVKLACGVIIDVVQTSSGLPPQKMSSSADILFGRSDPESDDNDSVSRLSISTDVDVLISHSEYVKVIHNVKEMLCQVCDHAHDRCVKLLVARAKDGFLERLTSGEFVTLSRAIETFVADCESVCGRRSTSLRGSLQSQANKFVNRFHEERKTKLSLILDNERWRQADVPAEFQDLVDHISVEGKLVLPERKLEQDKKPLEYLIVNGEKYTVVGTVLMLLKMVVEYCDCVDDIPSATPDILTRLIELLKMFNSRTCQLVLGAGALQLVGLKTITTKNLALASRCLQLVVKYLPLVRQHFEDRLQGKQQNMLKHFDHVLKDYNDHICEIANKLVAIMDSMFDMYLAKWEVRAPMPSACFRALCKQMTKLHEALTDLLPAEQIKELFERIHSSFKTHLKSQLVNLNVTNDGGPQHGLVTADVAFYTGNIKALPGLASLSDNMEDIWASR